MGIFWENNDIFDGEGTFLEKSGIFRRKVTALLLVENVPLFYPAICTVGAILILATFPIIL